MLHDRTLPECPVDLHDVLSGLEKIGDSLMRRGADHLTGTRLYALATGWQLNAMQRAEQMRRAFMPWFPRPDMSEIARVLDKIERDAVEMWGFSLDALQYSGAELERRRQTWERVTTTPFSIAQSKKELVWESGIVKLYRYEPVASGVARKRTPLLLVFAIMNTPWILDLYPKNSFVEFMVGQGYDVYLVDWGSPGHAERSWNFETYAHVLLPQIAARVKELSRSDEISILSWCLGAVISTIYAATSPNDGLKNLILLTPPLDFSSEELKFRSWLGEIDVDLLLRNHGDMMPAELVEIGAQLLKPHDNTTGTYRMLWHRLDDERFVEGWHAMHTWLKMNVSMPGAAYQQVAKLYLENALVNGGIRVGGKPVSLANARANLLAIVADQDHITPRVQMDRAFPHFTMQDRTLLSMPGGHIGVMAGRNAVKTAWPAIDEWLAPRSL